MSIVTLTYHHPDPTDAQVSVFAFEHMMATRNYFVAMAPLSRFSLLPYMLDPFPYPKEQEAHPWNLNHQQAHNDALASLPKAFGATDPEEEGEPVGPDPDDIGLSIGQILRDTNFDNARQVKWWTFQNHMEHYIANNATFPETAPTVPPWWRWPFW
jgi:hypothetical protein